MEVFISVNIWGLVWTNHGKLGNILPVFLLPPKKKNEQGSFLILSKLKKTLSILL